MATFCGVGLSDLSDSFLAGKTALTEAIKSLKETDNYLIIVFATDNYDHQLVLKGVKSSTATDHIIGFTVAGVFNSQEMKVKGVIVGVIQSDEMDFCLDAEENLSYDQRAVGSKLGSRFSQVLGKQNKHSLQLLFPDGLSNTVGRAVDSLFKALGSQTKYAGGGSGDNRHFLKTSQYLNDKVLTDSLVGALITSAKKIGVATSHGWKPISSPMIVTSAEGHVIKELDWQNAYDVYSQFAQQNGDISIDDTGFAEYAMSHPFGIPQAKEGGGYIVRDPISTDADGAIHCVGEVPENSVLRILHGDKDSLLEAVKDAARDAKKQLGANPVAGVLVFTCVSRCILLKDHFIDEVWAIREIMGDQVPIWGCMTFGEIGAIGAGPPEFHNKAVVICVFPG
ncbi:Uncharacterized conserved protein, contains FIST_N domain [Desulfuromusa kysingii]|uniref:Uncharacterized conserved protein, contains FIST_N domain n=1 Tax=Desulfuromusa kysingii TaxID=37625 RepID=A0A1H3VSF9_9BACT|nr:FIST N-terminal domain-containing protein [Desulfuromusa kysingii]SDZ77052.1 Uncharacterized conserved protein, contains FIST_N domain [Desulfuromusa kysingii]